MDWQSCRLQFLLVLLAVGANTALAVAQEWPPLEEDPDSFTVSTMNGHGMRPVAGVPYSADQYTERFQLRADGTKFDRKWFVKIYQDSEGRTRYELIAGEHSSGVQNDLPDKVMLNDPTRGTYYILDPSAHTAQTILPRIVHLTDPHQPDNSAARSVVNAQSPLRLSLQSLGGQVMQGLQARGTRYIKTYPAGTDDYNGPLRIIEDDWASTNPHMLLLRTITDPRTGQTITRMANILWKEPAAELFQVPHGYQILPLRPSDYFDHPERPID